METKDSPKLTISITNFNTRHFLQMCLESIYKTTKEIPIEIIVVDNASIDGSPEVLEREFPQVKLIRNETDLGFGRANNKAIRVANGEYILILSSDVILLPQTLEKMVEFMDDNPNVGVVTPKLLNPDMTLQKSIAHFPTLKYELFLRLPYFSRYFDIYNFNHNKLQEIENFTGACYLVRKKVIDQIGGFDEDFYLYVEETEWFFRMRKNGIRIYFLPQTEVIHYGGASTKNRIERTIMYYKSLLLFFKKAYGMFKLFLLRIISIISNTLSIIKLPLIIILPKSKRKDSELQETRLSLEILRLNLLFYPK